MVSSRTRRCLLALAGLLACATPARPQGGDPAAAWDRLNLGPHVAPGDLRIDERGIWTLRAHHLPSSSRSDGSFFVHRPLLGDGSVVALLMGVADQEGAGVAGVALRESAKAGARSLFVGLGKEAVPALHVRRRDGRPEEVRRWDPELGPGPAPVWLRWQREGDRFTPFASRDGYGWYQLHAPIALPRFPREALAGIAGLSGPHDPLTAVFDSPTVLPGQVSPLVRAYAGNGAVLLVWEPVKDAVGYRVRRAGPDVSTLGADLLTPEPIRETSYSALRLPNGREIRFLVSALLDRGAGVEETWATAVSVTPVDTPPSLFGGSFNAEVVAARGAFDYDPVTGIYRVAGAGDADRRRSDAGFMAGRWLSGDFDVTVRLLDRPAHQAGLMARDGLDGPGRVFFLAANAADEVVARYRLRAGAALRATAIPPGAPRRQPAPLVLRLVRRGSTLSAFQSPDGQSFKAVGRPVAFRPPLPESLYVGCAVVSPDPGTVAVHRFADLLIE